MMYISPLTAIFFSVTIVLLLVSNALAWLALSRSRDVIEIYRKVTRGHLDELRELQRQAADLAKTVCELSKK